MTTREAGDHSPPKSRYRRFHEKFVVEERLESRESKRNLYRWSIALVIVGLAGFFYTLYAVTGREDLYFIDEPVRKFLFEGRSDGWTLVLNALSLFFGPGIFPFFAVIFTVAWGFKAKHLWRPLLLAIGTSLVIVSVRLIAEAVGRERPPEAGMMFGVDSSESFPSGHVGGAASFILLIAYLVFSRRKAFKAAVVAYSLAAVLIFLTTVSRLYLGYHWATDGIGGIFLALVMLGGVIALDTYRTVRVDKDVPADGSPAGRS